MGRENEQERGDRVDQHCLDKLTLGTEQTWNRCERQEIMV